MKESQIRLTVAITHMTSFARRWLFATLNVRELSRAAWRRRLLDLSAIYVCGSVFGLVTAITVDLNISSQRRCLYLRSQSID